MTVIKKFNFEKKYLVPALYALFVICAAIAFEKAIGNITPIWTTTNRWLSYLLAVLKPFVYGLFIAYFLNPAMSRIETDIYSRISYLRNYPNLLRILSVITTYIILIGGILWMVAYLLPEVFESIRTLIVSAPDTSRYLERLWISYLAGNQVMASILDAVNATIYTNYQFKDIIDMILTPVMTAVSRIPNLINGMVMQTISAAYVVFNFVLGMIIAFYMLCDKEKFSRIATKSLYTIFRRRTADKIMEVAKSSNDMFKSFFMGKALDSTIIGVIFFIIALLMKLQYPLLLSLIIGVTNMIPYFGPFIGAVPVVIIVLLTNYKLALWTVLAIFILQQFDGNVLGPKILGDSTGLSPLGVIFSILVGGAAFGPLGMFLGVPVFAVISNIVLSLLDRKYIERKDQP